MGCTLMALCLQFHRFETRGWDGRRKNGKIRISLNEKKKNNKLKRKYWMGYLHHTTIWPCTHKHIPCTYSNGFNGVLSETSSGGGRWNKTNNLSHSWNWKWNCGMLFMNGRNMSKVFHNNYRVRGGTLKIMATFLYNLSPFLYLSLHLFQAELFLFYISQ